MDTKRKSRIALAAESGQAAVEFALVLPLLLVVLVGMIDFGFAFNYWIQQTQLASTGARYAAVSNVPGGGTVQDYVRGRATSALRDGGTRQINAPLQVCIDYPDPAKIGDPVTVEVKTTYNWMPFLEVGSAPIGAKATMRLEAIPSDDVMPRGCS